MGMAEYGPRMNPHLAWQLGLSLAFAGRVEEAKAWADSCWARPERHEIPLQRTVIATLDATVGNTERARKVLDELKTTSEYIDPVFPAWVHLALGDVDEAIVILEGAVEARTPAIFPGSLRWDPTLRRYHDDARILALSERLDPGWTPAD